MRILLKPTVTACEEKLDEGGHTAIQASVAQRRPRGVWYATYIR